MKNNTKKVKKIKKKIRFKRVFLALLILVLSFYLISVYLDFSINNIIIKGNSYLTDQEIIDIAGISNYPSILGNSKDIEKKLSKNKYIIKASIKKKLSREIIITVIENDPLIYDSSLEKTILKDGKKVSEQFDVPVLVNYIPDTLMKKFIEKMSLIDSPILKKISEIKYDPNTVDEERFLFTMSDQNKVYITLDRLEKINSYNDIMKKVLLKYESKKGTLYLDEGEYFVVNK